jgi:hypothetical protein
MAESLRSTNGAARRSARACGSQTTTPVPVDRNGRYREPALARQGDQAAEPSAAVEADDVDAAAGLASAAEEDVESPLAEGTEDEEPLRESVR